MRVQALPVTLFSRRFQEDANWNTGGMLCEAGKMHRCGCGLRPNFNEEG